MTTIPPDLEAVSYEEMPNPTAEELSSPLFEAIWQTIKKWDVSSPDHYAGYCGANGSHVTMILRAIGEVMTTIHKACIAEELSEERQSHDTDTGTEGRIEKCGGEGNAGALEGVQHDGP